MIRLTPLFFLCISCSPPTPAATDTGAPANDTGNVAIDAGNTAADAQGPVIDSGIEPRDAGTAVDASEPLTDTGTTALDGGSEPPPGDRPLRPGVQEISVEQRVEGELVQRRVLIQAPARIDERRRYPVVFAFHGNGGRPQSFVGQLRRFVDEGRFIAILPEGLERSWNLGREASQADDIAFVGLIMRRLSAYPNLDLTSAFAYGFSNGSALVNQLAARTDYFRAYAMGASALVEGLLPPDDIHLASFLSLHGTEDRACPYDGGRGVLGYEFLPVEDSAALWASKIGCSRFPISSRTDDGNRKLDWSPCDGGHRVIHYGFQGAGHGLPNDQEGGLTNLIVEFFEATP